jgi:SMODS and SLOG-associating 2TM effector domain 2
MISYYLAAVFMVGLFALVALFIFLFRSVRNRLEIRTALPGVEFPDWDSQDARKSLQILFVATVKQGESAIAWYRDNIRMKRFGSQILRSAAIVLASIGALLPLVVAAASRFDQSNTWKNWVDAQWGYIAFATAAACVAADKFYGFSSGWIRYMKTQMALEGALTDLRYDWIALLSKVATQQPTGDQIQGMLQKMKDFVVLVRTQVQQETDAWVLEFQANLADLTNTVKAQRDAQKPGSAQVTVSNAKDFDGGVKVQLDQSEDRTIEGTQCLFASVAPGTHEILVIGKKGDQVFKAATVVKVAADSLASVSVALPVP